MPLTKTFLSALLLLSVSVLPALAQEKEAPKKGDAPQMVGKPAGNEPSGPLKAWIDAENELIKPLNQKDQESFFILRNKYSIIRVIGVVERDIANAVKSCGEKNPDMKSKMDTRFKQWKDAVNPIIDLAKKQLDEDLEKQTIVDIKKAREVFRLNDAAYEYGEKQITKTPVSTAEACQSLLDSMDRTESEMISLLQQTLLPESVIRRQTEQAKKAEAAKNSGKQSKPAEPAKAKTDSPAEPKEPPKVEPKADKAAD